MKRTICWFLCLWLMLMPAVSLAGLAPGQTGEEVRLLQQRLITLGLLNGDADGNYGQKTQNAVSEAQRLLMLAGCQLSQTSTADDDTNSHAHYIAFRDECFKFRHKFFHNDSPYR